MRADIQLIIFGATSSVSNALPPANAGGGAAPVVTGTATQGQTLSCTTGTWTGAPTITYAYQWYRALVDGSNNVLTDGNGNPLGTPIGGATSSTYVLVLADVGSKIFCTVTASNAGGSTAADSNVTAAVASSVWTPASLPNLKSWHKADVGVFSDLGTTPAVNNGTVEQWNDQSGNGFHLTNTVAAQFRPTYKTGILNGKPVINFDPSSFAQHLFNSSYNQGGTTVSAFIVVKYTADGPNSRIMAYESSSGSDADAASWLIYEPSLTQVNTYNNGNKSVSPITSSSWNALGTIFDGVNNTMYKGGVAQTPVAATPTFSATGLLVVGATDTAGNPITAQIAEIVIVTDVMSGANITNLTSYLSTEHGI